MIIEGSRKTSRVIMHVDFDYFFAQCEEIRKPELKSKPVVVCVFSGRTEDSGVVSTANYVARKHGVKSGIPIKVAKSRLVNIDAVFLPLDSGYYQQMSEAAMSVISPYADRFEHVGIDECYIDVSRQASSFEAAKSLALQIKNDVKNKTQLTCSIGVAPNKMLAKIASDLQKPNGLTIIEAGSEAAFITDFDADKIPGIGPKTRDRLAELGVKKIRDLANFDLFKLIEEFGKKSATYMHNASRGLDDEPVEESEQKQQIGRIVTLKSDAAARTEMQNDLYELCQSVLKKTADKNLLFKTVGVLLILDNLENVTRSKSLKVHSNNFDQLYSAAMAALDEVLANIGGRKVRRLGVKLSDLQSNKGQNTMLDFMKG